MSARRLGVFVCQCGGNISDYVDVEHVRGAAAGEDGVEVAESFMFACSDAAQQEMIDAIRAHELDGIVVASCSPKLHEATFRGMAERGGLNPYLYTQANIREQCSWAHRRDLPHATSKATSLVRAAVARTRLTRPLSDVRVKTVPAVLVIGGGVAGLRAAVALADLGLAVHLVERESELGGRVRRWGPLFSSNRTAGDLLAQLTAEVRGHPNIVVYTCAELTEKSGSAGRFDVTLRIGAPPLAGGVASPHGCPQDGCHGTADIRLKVGGILVATGFEPYAPPAGELGRGHPGVLTLPELTERLAHAAGPPEVNGRRVRTVAYLYCVGSRGAAGESGAQPYCSRYCCTAAVHTALQLQRLDPAIDQYHLYRDMRTYGRHELLYEEAARAGSVFVRVPEDSPVAVVPDGEGVLLRTRDELTDGSEIEIAADLVVLVTGMVGGEQAALRSVLGLPAGVGGFFNEVHPKLRPVETAADGIFLAGAAQGPRTVAESVSSALAAAARCAALLLTGELRRAPIVASIDAGGCTWCGECARACPQPGAIVRVEHEGRGVAEVRPELCKGCGACVPVCGAGAMELEGSRHDQIGAMIQALGAEVPA